MTYERKNVVKGAGSISLECAECKRWVGPPAEILRG
jgi:hypothetical protein